MTEAGEYILGYVSMGTVVRVGIEELLSCSRRLETRRVYSPGLIDPCSLYVVSSLQVQCPGI